MNDEAPDQMNEHLVSIFGLELISRTEQAQMSLDYLREEQHLPTNHFWYHLESLLGSITAVANILWTNSNTGRYKRRSRFLREAFGIEEALDKSLRDTRNWFEHFDEKIDDWYSSSARKNFVDRNIASEGDIAGIDLGDTARGFDPSKNVLSVFGRETDIAHAISVLSHVHSKVKAWHETKG